jgi:hypothetical protein
MQFISRINFSLKTVLALMLVLTCLNLAHTRNFYENTLHELRQQSLDSESSYNNSSHYAVLNKYEDYVEQSKPSEAKQFYASHNKDYPASITLRNTIGQYGFYELDKYNNIHHAEITHFSIFKHETLLFRECDWFSLSDHWYAFDQLRANKHCGANYLKINEDPVLSEAIKQELADKEKTANANKALEYSIARNEAIDRFVKLLLASSALSLLISFLIKRYMR